MTTNRTVPAHHRAAMNGLAMLGGSLAKAAGPIFAGLLFSESAARIVPPLGSVVVWVIIACMGLAFFVQTLLLPEHVDDEQHMQGVTNGNRSQLASKEVDASLDGKEDRPPSF